MQCTQSVDNTCVTSCIFITLLCNNYFPQKFISHKDLKSLLHSFPFSPAVVCSGLRCILRWCAVICGGLRFSDLRYRAFSLPGQFAPQSESANRTLADSLPGQLAPWPFRSLAISLPGTFAPRPFRSGRSKSLFVVQKFIQRNQSNMQ